MEIPSTQAGTVTKIHVQPGDTLPVGGVIVSLDADSSSPVAGTAADKQPQAATSTQEAGPEKAENPPEQNDEDVDTDNQDAESNSPPAPRPQPQLAAASSAASPSSDPSPASAVQRSPSPDVVLPAGPAMRRFAREVGVDLRNVKGTGVGGRITRGDILRVVREGTPVAAKSPPNATAPASNAPASNPPASTVPAEAPPMNSPSASPSPNSEGPSTPAAPGASAHDDWGKVRIEKMPKIRQTIAAKMHESWSTIPRVTNFDDADVTELEKVRQASKADYASAGIKLTMMPFLIKACSMALRANPVINASIDMENGQVIYKDYVNLGIAVDTDRGLIVPSMRNADRLSIPDIARELADMAENVRMGKFGVDDLRGSTFTISNLGAIGGTYSTPIINPPEVAILLVGRARKMPVVGSDHQFAVQLMMPMSISYDHRLVDGAAAARFLNDVKSFLQSPSRLLLAP